MNTFNILIMKIFKLLLYSVASALILAGCTENEENFGDPSINVDPAELSFGTEAASNTVTLVATRDWTAAVEPSDADWITVEPAFGDASTDAQTVTVTVLENAGANRSATVTFAANNGMVSAPLEVTQTGPGGEPELEIITIAEFLKANVSDDVWYTLKGQITDLYNTDYGNFTLVDETGSVKVYGLTAEKVDKNDQSFSTLGLKEGDIVTLCGTRDNYNGEDQVGGPSYYISHEEGELPEPEPVDAVYFNDFDKEAAQNNGGWPFLDNFDGWKNEAGSGAGAVVYKSSGASARTTGGSSGSYSDYDGSGVNNIFFGSNAYFQVGNITLGSESNYTLSFGTEKYDQDGDSKFNHSEFHVYISNDGVKWIELDYSFPNGAPDGRWDLASTTFTVPSGTSVLYFYFNADVASVYRLDDLMLDVSAETGTVIDFSKGIELGGGGETPGEPEKITIADFIDAPVDDNVYYILTGKITDLYDTDYGNFTLVDETGSVKVYGLTAEKVDKNDQSFSTLGLKEGDTVTLCGTRDEYGGESQVGGPAYYISHEPGEEEPEEPVTPPADGYLIISEYVEGSSYNKYLEIYNPTGSDVDLSSYSLVLFTNGDADKKQTFDLTGTISAGATKVYKNSQAKIYTGEAEVSNDVINFNGNDPIALLYGNDIVDMFGPEPQSGKTIDDFAKDVTVRRNVEAVKASPIYVESDWTVVEKDDVSNLGKFTE